MDKPSEKKLDRLYYILFMAGMFSLTFLAGGIAVYLKKQPYDLIDGAFEGTRAWQMEIEIISKALRNNDIVKDTVPKVEQKPGAYKGYTLFTINPDPASHATLVDMDGNIVHEWSMPYSKMPTPAWAPLPYYPDSLFYWHDAWLFPNGDLMVVVHNNGYCPYGAGIVKLDKDSHVIWSYGEHVNHRIDVRPDGSVVGVIHDNAPPPNFEGVHFADRMILVDDVVFLSPEGKETKRIPLLDAFANSPYKKVLKERVRNKIKGNDPLHPNTVMTLTHELAPAFPMFKEGQVLISLRNIDALVVLDPDTKSIVWLARGIWKKQHDAIFDKDGTILLFDNEGKGERESRVLRYNPATKETTVVYEGTGPNTFFSGLVGMQQPLPNGNVLITETTYGRILEVTPQKEVVWKFTDPYHHGDSDKFPVEILTGKRYAPEELPFLNEQPKAAAP